MGMDFSLQYLILTDMGSPLNLCIENFNPLTFGQDIEKNIFRELDFWISEILGLQFGRLPLPKASFQVDVLKVDFLGI